MRTLIHFCKIAVAILGDQTGALTFTPVKRFKPHAGVRRGLVDITFDTAGPTWSVTKADLALKGGIWNLILPAHIDGFVLSSVPVALHQTITIDSRQEEAVAAGGGLVASTAGDLNTKVVRAEYIGY